MNWLIRTIGASIGKKLLMALTGLGFCGFLLVHLSGNLTIFRGASAFNTYAERLHSLGPLLTLAELGLLLSALVHIGTGLLLFIENRRARPVRYAVKKSAGGQTFGAATMPYTGLLVLAFVILHLLNFTFVDKSGTTIFDIMSRKFSSPLYVFLYITAVAIVAIHIRHGFWSAFQTIGANHPNYMVLIQSAGWVVSLGVGIGFGTLPLYISLRF